MAIYWFLLALPIFLASIPQDPSARSKGIQFGLLALFYVLVIGLRDHVGMDWNNYLFGFRNAAIRSFESSVDSAEIGFSALNWFIARNDLGFHTLNLVSAVVFTFGLFSYARQCANPWLAIAAVTPYLVVAIAMSALRQSMSIGIFLYLLSNWPRSSPLFKIGMISIATLFHSSAFVLIAFVIYESRLNKLLSYFLLLVVCVISYYILSDTSQFEYYDRVYIDENLISPGAIFHVSLNVFPAAVYLIYRRKFARLLGEKNSIIHTLALVSIATLLLIPISSTGVDRMSLYFSAVQMYVLSALPYLFARQTRTVVVIAIYLYLALQMFVWLNLANNSDAYIPYSTILF